MSPAAMLIKSASDVVLRQTPIVVLMLDDRAPQAAQDSDILDVADLLGGFQAASGRHGIDISAGVVLYLRHPALDDGLAPSESPLVS